jgi:NitT/TauT family transport system ATP-binding protein
MIEVTDVTVRYDDVVALGGVSLDVADGEFVTVIGPSGCGKTTLLRTIGGRETPTSGTVRIDGDPPATAQATGALGYVFQEHTLFPWKSALENVTFLRELADKSREPAAARDLLDAMGLSEFADAYPDELSGGMKQRVAIARAIHLGARVLLMDEPFGELDELTREKMGIELRSTWRTRDSETVVFVTHSVPEAVLLGDRCVVMDGLPGRIEAVHDVDLPAVRDRSVLESDAYQDEVARVRRLLYREP